MRQSPQNFGSPRSRWTLALLRQKVEALADLQSLSGVWRRLRKWKIVLKRGRRHLHSPDPLYQQKLEALNRVLAEARNRPGQVVVLFADEKTFYRQPAVAPAYALQGSGGGCQLLAPLSHRSNTKHRLGGLLNAVDARVLFEQGSVMGIRGLQRLLERARAAYPHHPHHPHHRLVVAWDNWPVHRHESVLAKAAQLEIELLWLPTYAPWTNPIEKLWRKLQEEILNMHRLSDQWDQLKQRVSRFLSQFDQPSPDLLRYVGLASSG